MKQLSKNWLEWVVFGASSVIVLATLGYVLYLAFGTRDTGVNVEVRLGPSQQRGAEFAIPVTVTNRGDGSAEAVLIRVELDSGEGAPEESDLEIPMLPGHATRRGWAMFTSDPRQGKLTARTMGYHTP